MTSANTDAATRACFAAESRFCLEVHFVRQCSIACVDFTGRPLPAGEGRAITAPDGHGGMLAALAEASLCAANGELRLGARA